MAKKQLGVEHWVHDVDFLESLELLAGRPTVNIEGLVGGYTGPGGKTILPHRAVAKLDLRLVPDMTAAGALAASEGASRQARLRRYRSEYDGRLRPHQHAALTRNRSSSTSGLSQGRHRARVMAALAGSWPGYVFTGDPLRLPAGHFGMGHGNGAHAPDEYYVIESGEPESEGMDGAAHPTSNSSMP